MAELLNCFCQSCFISFDSYGTHCWFFTSWL